MPNEQRRPGGGGAVVGFNGHPEDTAAPTLGQAASLLAGLGWPVFPCLPRGKTTLARLAPNAVHSATADREAVARWWRQEPRANIGLACGVAFFVLDIDADKGGHETLGDLEERHGELPDTVTSWTGSGGMHLLFKPDARVKNWSNRGGPGIDTRSTGGYIVAPPSIHPSGRAYRWLDDFAPGERAIAEAPAWLLDLLDPPRPEPAPFVPPPAGRVASRYAEAAFAAELERVALAGEGERNQTLNRAAFSLAQLVAEGLLTPGDVAAALAGAALATGLDRVEIEKTLRSGLRAGMASPRGVRP